MTTLVLVGPHGVGKTTLAQALAARLGVASHAELGRQLASDPSWRPAGATAADAAAAFDTELFARELARDLAHPAGLPRVVETWHPGNLAYAARRSPAVVTTWLGALRARAQTERVLVLPLVAPRAVLARRQSEVGDLDFFREVGAHATGWARILGLPCLPPLDTADSPPAVLATLVLARLGGALPPGHPRSRSLAHFALRGD